MRISGCQLECGAAIGDQEMRTQGWPQSEQKSSWTTEALKLTRPSPELVNLELGTGHVQIGNGPLGYGLQTFNGQSTANNIVGRASMFFLVGRFVKSVVFLNFKFLILFLFARDVSCQLMGMIHCECHLYLNYFNLEPDKEFDRPFGWSCLHLWASMKS